MSKPSVLIDGTVFEGRGRIGIWRLFYEVISRTSADVDYTILLDQNAVQPLPSGVQTDHFSRGPEIESRRHVARKLSRPLRQARMRSRYPDHIWHPSFFSLDPRGDSSTATKALRVTTVYDMLAEDYFWLGDFAAQRMLKARCLHQSDAAIAISQATENRLLKYYPEFENRTRVVLLAADHIGKFAPTLSTDAPSDDSGKQHRYCLYVGGRYYYKHFEILVRALASPEWPDDTELMVVGRPFDEGEIQFIRAHGVANKIRLIDSASDDDLNNFYQNATCFVFPSLDEGFGLPVLEAQHNNCVPVLSDIPVFREVAGEGALYFSPHCVEELIRCVISASNSRPDGELCQAAKKNLDRFSWDQCAQETVQCYESLSSR